VPLMPAPEPRPVPLARARARLEFDDLSTRRQVALNDAGRREDALLVEALARDFADAVDRDNSTRGILRAGVAVEYVDAVVLTGSAGALVVDAVDYDDAPVYWRSRVGFDTGQTVIRGRDLDGYLRTGEARYAEQLGLPA
jgi:hypothetical protein